MNSKKNAAEPGPSLEARPQNFHLQSETNHAMLIAEQIKAAGNASFKSGDYDRACALYGESLCLMETAKTHSNLAAALSKKGDFLEVYFNNCVTLHISSSHFHGPVNRQRATARDAPS